MATATGWRGGEQQVFYLLSGLRERGLEPVLVAPGSGVLAERARKAGIRVEAVSSRGDLDLGAASRIRRILTPEIDILHLHTGHAHALGLLAVVGRSRPRVIVSRRVDFPIKGGALGRLKYGARVDRFLAVSGRVARMLVEGGVPEARVTTVYSGVDPGRFQGIEADPDLRGNLAMPLSAKLVGFVGALVPHKAPEDLVAALMHLPPHVHGLFVGEGKLEPALRRQAKAGGIDGRVHFLGYREDVPRLLRSLDVFCLPSHEEGLGTSVLDAMAAGVPVVGADGGGIPEMVEPGVSGLLAPAGKPAALARALARVLEDPDLARKLIEGGRRRVEAFHVDRMVDRTLEVYQEVLNAGPG